MSWEEDTDRVTHRERKRAIKRWERLSEKGSRKSRVSIGRDQEIWQKIWRRWPITRKSVRQVGVWKTLSDWRALFQLFRTTLLLIIKRSTPGSLGSKYRRRPNLPERATLDVFQGAHFWALVHFCRSIILWKKSLSENFSLSVFNRIFVFFSNDPSFCEHEVAEMYFEDFVFPDPHVALFSEHATWVYSALKPKCKLETAKKKIRTSNLEVLNSIRVWERIHHVRKWDPNLRWKPSPRYQEQRHWGFVLQVRKDQLHRFEKSSRTPICLCWVWGCQVLYKLTLFNRLEKSIQNSPC